VIVGVDVSAVPADPRGAGRYVIELVRALGARANVELRLEARRDDEHRWYGVAPGAAVVAVVPPSRLARLAWEQVAAPRFVDRWGVDVLHAPHYTMPEIAKVPTVVTVHDLTFFDHPHLHEKVKVSFFKRAITVASKRADAIVCVSEPTARRLHALLSPSVPVHVVPHGIDHETFRPDAAAAGGDDDGERLAELGVRPPYLAFVGTLEPRKDVATLVAAFDRLAADPRHAELTLVVAGGTGWKNEGFEAAVAASPHKERIVRTGYVDDAAVAALLRGAAAFVYPAIDEGFGLPVLEALACGTPTVTTTGSVMDALAEGAAFTAPVSDAGALADVIGAALSGGHDGVRRQHGLEVAARYTWDATAAAHEAVYADVAAARRR
jgi:glycosyltransferase involved in cell wall biosynthesis